MKLNYLKLDTEMRLFEENFDSPFHPQLKTVFQSNNSRLLFTTWDDMELIY